MNIHHLELFYYVARFGGISEAVRNMPYGIQQPAVSAQIIQLEETLGVTLFHRRPFALTQAGEELQKFIHPFFGNLEATAEQIRGSAAQRIRIGASEVVQRDHLPAVVQNLRKRHPDFKLLLREGYRPQLEAWLQEQEIDVAITIIEGRPASGINVEELIRLHLALVVPKNYPLKSGEELWKRDRIEEPLIALPAAEAICRHFQQQLTRREVAWFTALEVSSLAVVETYAANGFGIGLTLNVPKTPHLPSVRLIPLTEFPPVIIGAMWSGRRTPLMDHLIEECHARARFMAT